MVVRDKEVYYILIKVSIQQKDITIINIKYLGLYDVASNDRPSK